ncbi:MAG: lytic transglycosylase domain-containing protein [Acidobacteriota bacterium]|nr:lytic transglycosylase domain-containing protein [Acidobacteriota bacterium]
MSKLFLILLLALPSWAGEYAVLANGFRIHAERHETAGASVRLYIKDGVTELPSTAVASFEAEEVAEPPVTPLKMDAPLPIRDTRTLVREAAIRSGLPPTLVESVARVESAMRPEAVSPKGALGVMQLMPATARMLDADPRDTAQNIDAGARLLRELLIKYGGDVVKALSAYNAGEGAVDRYRGMPPYPETQDYVDKVIRTYVSSGSK